jgi:hexokinase
VLIIDRKGISIRLEAIVNDTVAGLLAGEYTEPSMRTSVVLGTGLNAATAVPFSKIGPFKLLKHHTEFLQAGGDVLVNTELSLLGGTIFVRTLWDDILIENLSSGVCFQPLEYLCSGYYLGEIVRVILVWAMESGCLFPKYMPYQMLQPFSFPSSLVATFAGDSTQELSLSAVALIQHLTLLDHQAPTLRELRMIKAVAQSVSVRAAGYMAVAIHALSEFTMTASKSAEDCNEGQSDRTTVGVSGAVFESLPGFKPACEAFLNDMEQGNGEVGGKIKSFTLSHVAHGTMVGSALAAAMCK